MYLKLKGCFDICVNVIIVFQLQLHMFVMHFAIKDKTIMILIRQEFKIPAIFNILHLVPSYGQNSCLVPSS